MQGVREAARLAKESSATLFLLHVVDYHVIVAHGGRLPKSVFKIVHDAGAGFLRTAETAARRSGIVPKCALVESMTGSAANFIVQHAKRVRADLIVIGTHGRRGLRRMLMGSDAEQVVRQSPVPVLLVRSKKDARPT